VLAKSNIHLEVFTVYTDDRENRISKSRETEGSPGEHFKEAKKTVVGAESFLGI